ncbi:GNAT family N-acetyltransferase [Paracoccus limosus]|uniref:GNAT family N-acetyltransferase n=1 Tax=Paracoccus limosus TaxID=913252 RepID=A0A844H3Z8_9RHOB|nr:GNAT family N-acetyltransferase [Paracoccus limosus]
MLRARLANAVARCKRGADLTANWIIRKGVPPALAGAAARLYWRSFGADLCPCALDPRRGAALVRALMQPDRALIAIGASGGVLGIAGLRGSRGGFLELSPGACRQVLGPWWGRLALAMANLHRGGETADLVLDGVAVRRGWQRQGIARALADAAGAEALRLGYPGLRAEVAAQNVTALAAWQALGFQPQGRQRLGWVWAAPAWVLRRPALSPAQAPSLVQGPAAPLIRA